MIFNKKCSIEEAKVLGIEGQINMDGLVDYKIFRKLTKDEEVYNAMRYIDKKARDYDFYEGVAELGYDDKPTIAANWNNLPRKLQDFLEDRGINIEWSDEWTRCDVCGKAVRTQPDSYGWTPSYVNLEYEMICRECYDGREDDVVAAYMSDSHYGFSNRALQDEWIDRLEAMGFSCWSEREDKCSIYETGWYPGQNDRPADVFKAIMKDSPDWQVVFVITDVGQFDVHWAAYVRKPSIEE